MQSIPCPVCKTPIPFEIEKLLNGMKFICPNCHAAIGLGDNSRSQVSEAMNLKSASNLNGNLNCSKELEHYAS